ncbi:MAG: hypothetical protein RI932_401 [Pseudomonadota bacterium]|jgi:hypothetical protein
MPGLTSLATLLLFHSPAADKSPKFPVDQQGTSESVRFIPQTVQAFGAGALHDLSEFEQVWTALFAESPYSSGCGHPKALTGSDRALLESDSFLVALRGFTPELCKPVSWYVASVRLDPCRIRLGHENKTRAEVESCAQDGKYSEMRFILQPVLKHDRGFFFPDAALHSSFSFKDFRKALEIWDVWTERSSEIRWKNPQHFFQAVRKHAKPNDVSLFISGPGQERWTFARVVAGAKDWKKDKLAQGGFHESLTDADLSAVGLRTPPSTGSKVFSAAEFLDPLKTTPLQGSCVGCHLAPPGRAARVFRHFGWGLAGEPVISSRVLAEAAFASREIQMLKKSPGRK